MKPILPFLTNKRLLGILIAGFVVASAIVGYWSQPSTPIAPTPLPLGLGGYGAANGPSIPYQGQAVAVFTTTAGPNQFAGSTYYGGRLVERNAYLTLEVTDVKVSSDHVSSLAASFNGYVASSSYDFGGSGADIVIRVPDGNFTLALHTLSILGKVQAQSISSDDVTEQYVNLQAQLTSYKTEEATLLRILNSSTTVNDALNTETALQNTQAQINDLEGQLQVMQRLVAFATINVQLTEAVSQPSLDFGDALNSALIAFYTVTRGMLILGGAIVPLALVGGVAYVPYRRFTRKKAAPLRANG